MKLSPHILAVSLALSVATSACANVTTFAPPEYLAWLDDLKKEMVDRGISQKTIDTVYAQDFYHPDPEVVKIDRKQVEFALTSTDYLNRVVNKTRVEQARKRYREVLPLLEPISKKYGVPANYIVAFWAVETNLGSNFGGYNTIDALTTLSYDKRRPAFFRNELYQALKIIDTWNIDFTRMQGSWAGAMGHFQFMPSTFNAYAVDADGDKQIDIWHSFEDAAASAANYLSSIGWQKNQTWGLPVSLPWNFNFADTGRNNNKSVGEWKKIGVKTLNRRKLPYNDNLKAAVIIPEGSKGNAYLVFENFKVIMKWNRSENYALAIGTLADYIADGKAWKPAKENPAVRLKTDDIIKVQSFINRLGLFKLDEDGQLGSKTREAVKKIQKEALLPQDGYPDYKLLRKINDYNPEIGFAVPVPDRKLHNKN